MLVIVANLKLTDNNVINGNMTVSNIALPAITHWFTGEDFNNSIHYWFRTSQDWCFKHINKHWHTYTTLSYRLMFKTKRGKIK